MYLNSLERCTKHFRRVHINFALNSSERFVTLGNTSNGKQLVFNTLRQFNRCLAFLLARSARGEFSILLKIISFAIIKYFPNKKCLLIFPVTDGRVLGISRFNSDRELLFFFPFETHSHAKTYKLFFAASPEYSLKKTT